MTAGKVSDYTTQVWLKWIIDQPVWAGLATNDPRPNPSFLSEVQGGQYSRVLVNWQQSARAIVNTNKLTWVLPGNVTIRYIVGYDEAYNGNLLFFVPIADEITLLPSGSTYQVLANTLVLAVDLMPGA